MNFINSSVRSMLVPFRYQLTKKFENNCSLGEMLLQQRKKTKEILGKR